MAKVQYKTKGGILHIIHIGKSRFFHGQKPVEVEDDELDNLLETYPDLELVEGKEEREVYTKASIKKLSADEQRELIVRFAGDPEETNNEDERVALILQLQEDNKQEGE